MQVINLGNRFVNNYIFKTKAGYILIDTGYENSYQPFLKKLRRNNISLNDIAYVFLTHAHDDHAGFLNELLSHCEAKVILSEKAAAGLKRGQNSFDGGCSTRLAYGFCRLMALAGRGSHRFPPMDPQLEQRYITVNSQTKRELESLLRAKIIDTPGHTNCSISLLLEDGALFCGDAAMNGFPSLYRATIWVEDLQDFCASWGKIIQLEPNTIYPGHGSPFGVPDLKKHLEKVRGLKLFALKYKG